MAARDPKPGARNRPGFDLGGATGDAKPDSQQRINSTVQPQDSLKKEGEKAPGDAQFKAKDKVYNATGKVRSAVAGVRNWLRNR